MATLTACGRRRETCRASGSADLRPVLSLGEQALTGRFPPAADPGAVPRGPLELVWCPESALVQLRHSFDPESLYGEEYGYRSGLNGSMVRHLALKARSLARRLELDRGDTIVDIGSNDGTFLGSFDIPGLRRVGVDPTGEKFRSYYPRGVELIPDFFSLDALRGRVERGSARLVSSIAMFYDLEDPVGFAREVGELLAPDGLWHFEQSYLPSMLARSSYDTICHEHLEYYSFSAVQSILCAAGWRAIDVSLNDTNGGSFAVTAARVDAAHSPQRAVIEWLLGREEALGLRTLAPFRAFEQRVYRHRDDLVALVRGLRREGKRICGYGASTKGNVLLQFCGFTAEDIECIAEVNEDKFGRVTPGTGIPIVSEEDARRREPDVFLVLPWHFRAEILQREEEFLGRGGRMIFPLPEIEVVQA